MRVINQRRDRSINIDRYDISVDDNHVYAIYAYEIDANREKIDEKMEELVKQYYEENGGKIYAKFERICRAKS